jgi:lipoyl-dependent peroxiredoxin
MAVRRAEAVWRGPLKNGRGTIRLGSGAFEGPYSFNTRFAEEPGTNPEELIGAAHAGCFAMAFSKHLSDAGHDPEQITTRASVKLEPVTNGFAITEIHLDVEARVPGLGDAEFQRLAEDARLGCPVSKALAGVIIRMRAALV